MVGDEGIDRIAYIGLMAVKGEEGIDWCYYVKHEPYWILWIALNRN